MPEVAQNMDRERLKAVRLKSVILARLWLDMYVATSNGDVDGCKGIYKRIRDETVAAADSLRAIGSEASQGGQNG